MIKRASAVACLLVSLSLGSGLAQRTTGNIEGRIVTESGEPVSFANITVSGPNLQGTRGVMSTSSGHFGVFKLPAGEYTVKIFHVSYHEATIEKVIVYLGRSNALGDIKLEDKIHEAPKVVVVGRKPVIDPTTTITGINILESEFENLPIQRNYQQIPALLPQANESGFGEGLNYSGATGIENSYFVDGVDVTDPGLGQTGTTLPYNFIQEVEIITGGYEAEYRSSLGGMMNVVSHSGSNRIHGNLYGFFTNNSLSGEQREGIDRPETGEYAQYDIGLSLGGPIKRDKLWFYLAYDPTFVTDEVEVAGTGLHTDQSIAHIFAGKLTWRAATSSNLTLSIFGDPSTRESVGETFFNASAGTILEYDNPDPVLADGKWGGINGVLRGDFLLGDRTLLDASVSVVGRRFYMMPRTEQGWNELSTFDARTNTLGGGFPVRMDNLSIQTTVDANATFLLGSHSLKGGVAFRDNRLDQDVTINQLTIYDDTTYAAIFFEGEGTVHNRIPSAYVQDSWRISDLLRINAGVRWDGQYLIDSNGELAQRITDQFAPRLGFIVLPKRSGTHKLFGSFGRFYHNLSMSLSGVHHVDGTIFTVLECKQNPAVDTTGCMLFNLIGETTPEVGDLKGQFYDEFILGYELGFRDGFKLGVRGVYRELGAAIVAGPGGYGNPGRGAFEDHPDAKREYRALVISLERTASKRLTFLASYVLSRNEGNYPGFFNSIMDVGFPNAGPGWDDPEHLADADGVLPNDRTHVFKLAGSYAFKIGLTAGTFFSWQTGTPLSIYDDGGEDPGWLVFAVPRGTAGKTPTIWDLNLRFAYDLSVLTGTESRLRLLLDIFHLGSEREPLDFDQVRTFDSAPDGTPTSPNPAFGLATAYQSPTTIRLGLEYDF